MGEVIERLLAVRGIDVNDHVDGLQSKSVPLPLAE